MSDDSADTTYPMLEDGWLTVSKYKQAYGGSHENHQRDMYMLREALIGDIAQQHTGGDTKAATELVDRFLIGMRKINKKVNSIAASRDARRLLSDYPPLEEGWQTGSMRKDALKGDAKVHDREIRKLHKELIEDIAEQHTEGDTEIAAALVDRFLVGMRKHSTAQAAMAASPDAQRLLPKRHILEEGWQTGSGRKKAIGGCKKTHDAAIRKLRQNLIGDIVEWTKGDIEAATALAEEFLAGMRQAGTKQSVMAASPAVQRIMDEPEQSGWVKRTRGRPRKQPSSPAKTEGYERS